MYVSIQELVKGDVITDFKWEVKEDMNADLSGECWCAAMRKFEAQEEYVDHLIRWKSFHSAKKFHLSDIVWLINF